MPRQIKETPEGARRYQLMVKAKNQDGLWKDLRVGPILQFKPILEEQAAVINKNVAEGREKDWCEARVVDIDKIEVAH